jgi:hypothetical protein
MASTVISPSGKQSPSAIRIGIKAFCLLIVFNFLFIWIDPLPTLGRISIYNHLIPGRERFPYGEQPEKSYNLNLYQLDAMFNAHEIAGAEKSPNEFRVILIGDSSTWGFLLTPSETLASAINAKNAVTSDGKQIKAYNLGYPVMSLAKDLLILSRSLRYQPDMIVWLVTLESFPYDKQFFPPLLKHNRDEVLQIIQTNHLQMDQYIPELETPSLWDKTLIGQRRNLADIFRLQMYGILWAATGIDQDIPSTFERPMEDLSDDQIFHNLTPPHLKENDLAFDILEAGVRVANNTPVMIVNEPMYISHGINSDIRYNYYYPRWAYDDYRQLLSSHCQSSQWKCIDLWHTIEPDQFSNTAVHLTPDGVLQTADNLIAEIIAAGHPPK